LVTTNKKATTALKGGMSSAEVRAAMNAKLEGSDLSTTHAKALGLEPTTAEQCRALKLPVSKAGFKIPYWGADGKQLKFFRYRYMEETRTGFQVAAKAKALRYAQPGGSPTEIYLPPLVKWAALLADPATPLLITEGELKSACATRHGMPCIGLGGVWSFMSTKKGDALLPALVDVDWTDRTVFICYDSDGATNPNVVQAESRLAARLVEAGAAVFICRIPTPELAEGEETPRKVGIDDYIVEHGVDSFKENILELAFEFSASEALHKLSQRVVYVRNPGIMWDHQMRQRMAPSAFKEHAFSNVHYFEKRESKLGTTLVKVSAAKAWMDWEHRAECPGLQFAPGQGRITDTGDLNTWTGWGLKEPVPGDVKPWHSLTKHVFGGEKESLKYFEQWAAFPIQNPGVKMHVAAAVWGPVHGSGKTLLGHTLMRIYGQAHSAELKDADLESSRYEWAENIQFALADDITSRGDRKFMRKLMTMITQKYIRLDPKYIPSYSVIDAINYYFTSNDPDALFMDDQDRRFFVHEVRAGKYEAWREYVKWMKSDEGIAALWHYLLEVDMEGFDPHAPAPTTLGKESMIELGKSELGAWVYELKQNTDSMLVRANLRGDLFTTTQLHLLFDPHGDKKASVNALGRELKRAGYNAPGAGAKLRLPDGRTVSVYAVRNADHWHTASWKDACKHYIDSNPELTSRPTGKKF
jgi:Domain of unknown function (DUF3854)/Family of unknown function (DUF5906)